MNARAIRLLLPLAGLLVGLFAAPASVQARAHVICRGTALGVECTVPNPRVGGMLRVSWDIRIRCRNGVVVRASAAQKIPQDTQFVHLIPVAELNGLDRCDLGQKLVVENVSARNSH